MSKKRQKPDATHLTLDERRIIEAGIGNGCNKASIARTIGKDETTVAKEIRKHRQFIPRNTYGRPVLCEFMKSCPVKPCQKKCDAFMEPRCTRRDRSPGACNKCPKHPKCVMDKYHYDAQKADEFYRAELVASRDGFSLTPEERETFGKILAPLLKQGQSIHQVLAAHPEITVSERTVYTYIESGVFKDFGVDCFSLKEQVQRKQFAKKYKKRKEPVNFDGRRYEDFLKFCQDNPDTPVTEMDTVLNDPSGPYLQTFLFDRTGFAAGFLHEEKTSASMAETLNRLQPLLGAALFSRLFPLILTDRGTEFEAWKLFEQGADGATRLRIFYCDPMQSNQKSRIENVHNYIRDVIPNGYPMDVLSQDDIDRIFSHINSTPRRALDDKTPFELFAFFYGAKAAKALGVSEVPRDSVVLKPELVFNKLR